jgi:hypothetical protein
MDWARLDALLLGHARLYVYFFLANLTAMGIFGIPVGLGLGAWLFFVLAILTILRSPLAVRFSKHVLGSMLSDPIRLAYLVTIACAVLLIPVVPWVIHIAYGSGSFGEPSGNRFVSCEGDSLFFRVRQIQLDAPVIIGFSYSGKMRPGGSGSAHGVEEDDLDTTEYTGDYYWECGDGNGEHGCNGGMKVLEWNRGKFLLQIACPATLEQGCALKMIAGVDTFTNFYFGSQRDVHPWDCSKMPCPHDSTGCNKHIDLNKAK